MAKNGKYKWWLLGSVCILFFLLFGIEQQNQKVQALQREVAGQVIRLHVMANSDSKTDQRIKCEIRDKVVGIMENTLQGADNKEEAEQIIKGKLKQIEKLTNQVLKQEKCGQKAKVRLTTVEFPVKEYGDTVFPAGEYETVQIQIGAAKGGNWWCVMYPGLCLVDESVAIMPSDSKKQLQEHLTEEDYAQMTQDTTKVKYTFRLVELWEKWKPW